MSAALELLLSRLDGVKQTGPDTYLAKCPGHADKSPSLSIRQSGELILVNDFAGCPTLAVLSSIGLKMSNLYDKPLTHAGKPLSHQQRRRYGQAQSAFGSVAHEVFVVCLAAESMLKGYPPEPNQVARLRRACSIIRNAYALTGNSLSNGFNT